MERDVQNPPGQQTGEAEEPRGLRALFRKRDAGDGDEAGVEPAAASPASRRAGAEVPAGRSAPRPGKGPGSGSGQFAGAGRAPARRAAAGPIVSRSLISPRLKADPRLRVWITRTIVSILFYLGFTLWLGWRAGVTAAAIYAGADTIYRSKTTAIVPASARVTSAQRSTRRRLRVLQPAGYLALHARTIPGTGSVIDHLVIGPAGVFSLDSQRIDRRLPLRAIGGELYHGPRSMADRLAHAQEEADQAAALIGAELGQEIRVRPAMVIYGPSIPWVIMKLKGVDVFDGSRVGTYFRRQSKATARHQLEAGQIAIVYAAATRALPPIR